MEVPDQLQQIMRTRRSTERAVRMALFEKEEQKYILRELQKAVGQANVILSEEKINGARELT
ncbi:hypothetical protein INR49_001240 [Caranx melampygus]|nr:hypothetical protein INR49_001240 [Caranx melampygus]